MFCVVVDRGVNAIVYMVDAADSDKIEAARNELHNLLEKPQLAGIPVLVLGTSSMRVFHNWERGNSINIVRVISA
jgi:hypothetical protein